MSGLLNRRALLALASATLLPLPRRASAIGHAVPQVDALELIVVVDGTTNVFAPSIDRPDLKVMPFGGAPDYHRSLIAQWGYSLLARSRAGAAKRTTLVDFGYTPEALLNNMALLGIDPAAIDAMVLSHGHYDHFGGLDGLLATGQIRRGTPLFVGGEEAFCARVRGTAAGNPSFGAIDRPALAKAGIALHVSGESSWVADQGFITGRIPYVSPERPKVPTGMLPGQNCDRALLDPAKQTSDFLVDDAVHELGTAYHVTGHGLVVIASCSHRGILNTVLQARAVSGVEKIHAIVGGFHLVAPQTHAQADETLRLMLAMNPDYIIPGHCSGDYFINSAVAAAPERVVRSVVGLTCRFGVA